MRAGLLFGAAIIGWVTLATGQANAETRTFVIDSVSYSIEILTSSERISVSPKVGVSTKRRAS